MGNRDFKQRLYEQFGRIGKALAAPPRLELLDLLAQGERSVESLANEAALTMGNASAHLQVLREARLVESRKEGVFVYYRLAGEHVFPLLRSLHAVAESQLAEVDQLVRTYLGSRKELDAITSAELLTRMKKGTVIVLDCRPIEEYRAGHIAGAVSIPYDEVARRMRELPRGKEIVAYCRGAYCVYADQAVETLKAKRRKALRLEDGFLEWRAAGFPMSIAAAE
jgi:rhodanese-related sulfurtransferase